MEYKFVTSLLCFFLISHFSSGKSIKQKDEHWDFLLFAQFWPASSCIYFKEKHESCSIMPNVKGWTIHGLWPSRPDSSMLPHNCNQSMQFDYSQVEALRPQLDLNWPYFNADKDPTYLWQHEWEKHGTCAYSLPALRGEKNYFNKTLELHSHINITKALEQGNILPSHSTTYHRENFFDAVYKFFKYKPVIVCDYDKEVSKTYIDQVYLCFTKSFQPQDCFPSSNSKDPSYYEKCLESDEIYYLPYNGNQQTEKSNSLIFKSEISKS